MGSAERLIKIFNDASACATDAERQRFVAEACGGDAELKQQVLSLLQVDDRAGDFLQPAAASSTTITITEKPGDRIGRYKLLEQIGEGGCGVVYMAEQEEPVRRRVALKVIKLGMDTKQVIARFEAERQALALMDHPNIAKVLDGGATDTGRPFFVMELVRGIKITDYCDQNNLSTHERLELFIQVCQAIQHAHQKGIIHRDIKPSNILVTRHDDVAVPKVIDFGIAKATTGQLTDKTLFTAFAQFVGTPAYMSPEQAQMSGLDVDTRADVYSLGVLLYELLTGNTPFPSNDLLAAGLDEMRRKIREEEPARPSTCLSTMTAMDLASVAKLRHVEPPKLIEVVRGDLDWLVMKCLEKDRTRRYETANALAIDVQRHLDNEPVVARPPSGGYRLRKLIQRNKLAFAATSAVAAALVIGSGFSTWMFFKEKRARDRAVAAERQQFQMRQRAEANEAKSKEVAQFLQNMLRGVRPSAAKGRDTTMLREILDKTSAAISNELTNQPEVEAELCNTIGRVYWELGQYDQAESIYRRRLELMRKLRAAQNPATAETVHHLAEVLRRNNKFDEAEATAREAVDMYQKLHGREHILVGASLNLLGTLLSDRHQWGSAEAMLREALEINRKTGGEEHPQFGLALSRLGRTLELQGKLDEAESTLRAAVTIQSKAPATFEFGLVDLNVELAWTGHYLATVLKRKGNLAEAITTQREALAVARKVLSEQHRDVVQFRGYMWTLLNQQGDTAALEAFVSDRLKSSRISLPVLSSNLVGLLSKQRMAEAEALLHQQLESQKDITGDAAQVDEAFATGQALRKFATVALKGGERPLAYGASRLAVRALEKAVADFPDQMPYRHELMSAHMDLLANGGDIRETRKALTSFRKAAGENTPEIARCLVDFSVVLSRLGNHTDAEVMMREALSMRRELFGNEHPVLVDSCNELTTLLRNASKWREAEEVSREAVAMQRKLFGNENVKLGHMLHGLAYVLHRNGKRNEAEVLSREELSMRRKLLGDGHYDVAWTLMDLGNFLRDQGRLPEAETTLREAMSIFRKQSAEGDSQRVSAFKLLNEVLRAQGKPAETLR
jgi:eukaryotic-like serine/threonine-protein kinase